MTVKDNGISALAGNTVLSVLGVLCGFPNQCWDLTAEDAEDAVEQRDNDHQERTTRMSR